ncbi:hypothetical protein [Actinophytocola sp.]
MWRQRIQAKTIRERETRKLLDRPPEPLPTEPPQPAEEPEKASASPAEP